MNKYLLIFTDRSLVLDKFVRFMQSGPWSWMEDNSISGIFRRLFGSANIFFEYLFSTFYRQLIHS